MDCLFFPLAPHNALETPPLKQDRSSKPSAEALTSTAQQSGSNTGLVEGITPGNAEGGNYQTPPHRELVVHSENWEAAMKASSTATGFIFAGAYSSHISPV